ncbi:uncharacterized protein HKW66_Vig0058970 [Vigna angularis]|uniref:Uncharacterized protein n=1 Tax=Phaseolus angularis TaxID=3914 RepID=A0A8T0L1R0_PHAAN|nr:uncharacterized protein HKW66_Vig0058970 [Vigna angularis]
MVSSCQILHLFQRTTSAAHSNSRLYHNVKNYKSADYKPLVLEVVVGWRLACVRRLRWSRVAFFVLSWTSLFRSLVRWQTWSRQGLFADDDDPSAADGEGFFCLRQWLQGSDPGPIGGVRVCIGGGETSIAGTTKEVMERDEL